MAGDKQTAAFTGVGRQLIYWRVVVQMPAARSMLPPLPDPTTARVLFANDTSHQQQSGADQSDLMGALKMATEQFQFAASSFNSAAQSMNQLAATIMQSQAATEAKFSSAMDKLRSAAAGIADLVANGDKPLPFNWMLGHGAAQKKFDRLKARVMGNAVWFIYNATVEELREPWIEFRDLPIVSVDGIHLKRMMQLKEEMSEEMGQIVVRVLRNDESDRRADADDNCHYVIHIWAREVMEENSTPDGCEDSFLGPKFYYDLANCSKVVAMLKIDDVWASVSIDMNKCITHLIHPALSGTPYLEVLPVFKPMMQKLTMVAVTHMKKLVNRRIPDIPWEFDVALKSHHVMHGPDTGVSTAFFSVPKNNQFLKACPETIYLAKLTFIYKGIEDAYINTKKSVQSGRKVTTTKKRGRDGKTADGIKMSGYVSDSASAAGSNYEGCINGVPEHALAYLP